MRPDNWTVISWAVSFGAHGGQIVLVVLAVTALWWAGDWWGGRRNRLRHEAIERAHAAAAPAWAHPDIGDDGEWERLHDVIHQHPQPGDDQQLQQQCEEIYDR